MDKQPLADRMRPVNLQEFLGQEHLIGKGKIISRLLEEKNMISMIFWGPPGSGKTTLARIIARETESEFIYLSAVFAGVKDIRKVIDQAKHLYTMLDSKDTIVFIDEIHRFNKAQQASLLSHVENGTITLIGATTENPSFELISPLLSRMRVFVFHPLKKEDIKAILIRAIKDNKKGLGLSKKIVSYKMVDMIVSASNGDARTALNILDLAVSLSRTGNSYRPLTKKDILQAMQRSMLRYDNNGEEHYNTISAFIKSMRASDPDASLYYLSRMVKGGEDPLFIARRMVIFASEDIGLALPTALVVANEVFRACEIVGYPECAINLAFGAVYLSLAPKDRSAYEAFKTAQKDVETYGNLPIPLSLRNAPTNLMKELGYLKGYKKYPKEKNLLPEKLKGKKYYKRKKL